MYYRYNDQNIYIGLTEIQPSDNLWTQTPAQDYVIPTWNGIEWVEGATLQDVANFRKSQVPQEVQLWRIRTILKLTQLETQIEAALNNLPEPSRTAGLQIWNYGTTVERNSQTVLILQSILQLTDEQVDDLFIEANQIIL